jgi:signal transduction histidine kinase
VRWFRFDSILRPREDGDASPVHDLLILGALLGAGLLVGLALVPPGARGEAQRIIQQLLFAASGTLFLVRACHERGHAIGWLVLAGLAFCHTVALVHPQGRAWATLVSLPVAAGALRTWFREGVRWAGGVRRVLEGATVAVSLLALAHASWASRTGAWPFPETLAVTCTAGLLGLAVYHARVDQRRLLGPLGWLAAGILALGCAGLWEFQVQAEGHRSAHLPLAGLVLLAPIPLGLAALAPWTRDRLSRAQGRGSQLGSSALVVVPFGGALLLLLMGLRDGRVADGVSVTLVGTAALMMLARQILAFRDQAAFARILGQRVGERSRALAATREAHLRAQRLNIWITVGSGLAHELNNLLGALCVQAEGGGSREELVRTAHQAAALARRSLAFAGDLPGSRELLDLGESLELLQPLLRDLAGDGVEVAVTRCGWDLWVEADPDRVEQVLVDLVTNARDALPGRGRIQITVDREESWIRLTVDDDGLGIPESDLPRIFDPFFTTKGRRSGAGLGLASVKAFVDLQGGRIAVTTEVGRGTRFTLRLPILEV